MFPTWLLDHSILVSQKCRDGKTSLTSSALKVHFWPLGKNGKAVCEVINIYIYIFQTTREGGRIMETPQRNTRGVTKQIPMCLLMTYRIKTTYTTVHLHKTL